MSAREEFHEVSIRLDRRHHSVEGDLLIQEHFNRPGAAYVDLDHRDHVWLDEKGTRELYKALGRLIKRQPKRKARK